jgi:hypothetical protein
VAWIEPIFDRIQADVDFALQQIQRWRDEGSSDITDLKGCFNVSDMNRIENDIQFLSDNLSDLYYFSTVNTKTWDKASLPTVVDINRMIENTRILVLSICEDAPELPTTLVTFTDVNCIEGILNKLKMILDDMTASFLECDTFECGEG